MYCIKAREIVFSCSLENLDNYIDPYLVKRLFIARLYISTFARQLYFGSNISNIYVGLKIVMSSLNLSNDKQSGENEELQKMRKTDATHFVLRTYLVYADQKINKPPTLLF